MISIQSIQKKLLLAIFTVLVTFCQVHSQDDSTDIKTGWTFGALPAIAYDTDRGFKYGGLVNFFNYGNGSTYPDYLHSIYLEWSRTTKGSGINQLLLTQKD